jgi:hypothetical protein
MPDKPGERTPLLLFTTQPCTCGAPGCIGNILVCHPEKEDVKPFTVGRVYTMPGIAQAVALLLTALSNIDPASPDGVEKINNVMLSVWLALPEDIRKDSPDPRTVAGAPSALH